MYVHDILAVYFVTNEFDFFSCLDDDMAGRHRSRNKSIQIIRTATVKAKDCKRVTTTQFHVSLLKLYDKLVVISKSVFFIVIRIPRRGKLKLSSPCRTAFSAHPQGL